MDKYISVALNNLKKNLVYRVNNFITVISILISFIMLFYFWSSIYRQGSHVGSYSFEQIISYYIFVAIFQLMVTGDNTAWSIGDEIKNGEITNNILKPINYLKYKFSQSMGNLLYRIMFYLPVITMIVFLLRNYFIFPHSVSLLAIFLFCASMSYILFFLVYFLVGIVAFWMGEAKSIFWALWVIIGFMQGSLIPLDLLPRWLMQLSNFLPFKYIFFIPISLITGRSEFSWFMIYVPLAWLFGLYILAQYLYIKGLKKYEGFGA